MHCTVHCSIFIERCNMCTSSSLCRLNRQRFTLYETECMAEDCNWEPLWKVLIYFVMYNVHLKLQIWKKSLKAFKGAERGSLKTRDRVTVFLPRAQNRNVRKMGHHLLLFENLSWFFWQKPHWHFVRRHLLRATFFLLHLMHAPKEKTKLLRPKSLSPLPPLILFVTCAFSWKLKKRPV